MSFGYPAPLGSTILLKGADEEQLVKIKQVGEIQVVVCLVRCAGEEHDAV
jgi:hypothetical protein